MKPQTLILTVMLLVSGGPGLFAEGLTERATFRGHTSPVQQMALSPDGRVLASGGGELKLWDAASGKELAPLPVVTSSPSALAFSPDGRLLASGDSGRRVTLWDVAARKRRATFTGHTDSGVYALAFSPDGKRLASAGEKEVKLWDVAGGKELASFRRSVAAWSMAFSPDLTTLASPNYPDVDLWDVATGKERAALGEHRGAVRRVAFAADGRTLAAASVVNEGTSRYRPRGEVKLWDVATGKERATLRGRFGEALALALSPDGKALALLGRSQLEADLELKLLDVPTSRVRFTHTFPARSSLSLTFAAGGKLLVMGRMGGSDGRTVKLWEVTPPNPRGR